MTENRALDAKNSLGQPTDAVQDFSLDILNSAVWALPAEEALVRLGAAESGLTDTEAEKRKNIVGPNEFRTKKGPSKLSIFLRQLKSPLIFLLIAAAILSGLLSEWVNTIIIALAVLVNSFLGFYQEYHAEKTLEKLTMYIKQRSRITRAGVEQEIDSTEIVPGDIVHLSYGARVPADCRLLSVNNLTVDESILTGESLPVRKNLDVLSEGTQVSERKNMIFAGTMVSEGYGRAVVLRTGQHTELGRIAELIAASHAESTPLQKSIIKFGWFIFFLIMILAAAIFFLGVMRGNPVTEMLILGAAIAVGGVPEALPISLTVILAIGAERLAKRNGVLRRLSAAETLGSATLIMTDKTGTLTEAKMKLVNIVTTGYLLSGKEIENIGVSALLPEQKDLLILALANIDVVEEKSKEEGKPSTFIGRPMEVNIAQAAAAHGLSVDKASREVVLPFSSSYKFSVGHNFGMSKLVALGAPDVLLARSKLSKEDFLALEEKILQISSEGKRVLGVAALPDSVQSTIKNAPFSPDKAEDLRFLGLIILHDPVRAEVPAAISKIEAAGVSVVMVTGDIKGTAMAIARELGWSVTEGNVLSGSELHQMSDEELLANLENIKIFARVTPEDKLRIGMLYQKLGKVVAMTGDGVNDAPSLRAVDIGVALGSGSDVAKSAADLVLLDDNFKTIAAAIEEGRRILANIRKSFVYLMSNSLDAVILLAGSLFLNFPLPLTALHLIWVNFFTGSLPALSYAFDDDNDKQKIGKHGSHGVFSREVIIFTAGIGVFTSFLLLVIYRSLLLFGLPFVEIQSIMFACFSAYILVVAFSFRSLRKSIYSYSPFSNKFLNISVLIGLGITVATYAVPLLRNIFGLTPLTQTGWLIVSGWLIFNVLLIEVTKWCFRISARFKKA